MVTRSVGIGELKNNLSAFLAHVRRGEEIVVKDRNVPIARIVPLSHGEDTDAELEALIAEGKVRPPQAELPADFWKMPAPRISKRRLLAAIRAEREDR